MGCFRIFFGPLRASAASVGEGDGTPAVCTVDQERRNDKSDEEVKQNQITEAPGDNDESDRINGAPSTVSTAVETKTEAKFEGEESVRDEKTNKKTPSALKLPASLPKTFAVRVHSRVKNGKLKSISNKSHLI